MSTAPTAMLVVRAWSEPGSSVPHRYSIRWTNDLSLGLTDERTFHQTSAALGVIGRWLDDLERGHEHHQ